MKKLSLLLALVMLCGCFILAACGGETAENSSATSSATSSAAGGATSSEASSAAAESSEDPASEPAESSETPSEPELPEAQMFWVTHYNNSLEEAAGAVFSTTDTSDLWWTHVAFKPVEDKENVYEIVEISVGVGTGAGHALAVPEGGFVYGINTGNDYPTLAAQNPDIADYQGKPNYTNDNTFSMVAAMGQWKVGDQLLIQGVDFENYSEVPTETPDTLYYEEGYVCTATWQKVN